MIVIESISRPSVILSAFIGIDINVEPVKSIFTEPASNPPVISEEFTPVKV